MLGNPRAMSLKVRDILLKYRATSLRSGKSPFEMYLALILLNASFVVINLILNVYIQANVI